LLGFQPVVRAFPLAWKGFVTAFAGVNGGKNQSSFEEPVPGFDDRDFFIRREPDFRSVASFIFP
jgi:hypothetical protein